MQYANGQVAEYLRKSAGYHGERILNKRRGSSEFVVGVLYLLEIICTFVSMFFLVYLALNGKNPASVVLIGSCVSEIDGDLERCDMQSSQ
jgi:hypothetical protein